MSKSINNGSKMAPVPETLIFCKTLVFMGPASKSEGSEYPQIMQNRYQSSQKRGKMDTARESEENRAKIDENMDFGVPKWSLKRDPNNFFP